MRVKELSENFILNGSEYQISDLSENGQTNLELLSFAVQRIQELRHQITLLNRSKNGYIYDLKTEIVGSKSGVDLSSIFMED